LNVVAEGNVELRKRNSILLSDRLTYRQPPTKIEAEGNVRLSRDGDRVQGPRMQMKMEDSTGFFEQPEYSIRRIKTGSAATLWTGNRGTGIVHRDHQDLTTGRRRAAPRRAWTSRARASTGSPMPPTAPARRLPGAIRTGSPAPPTCALTTMRTGHRARCHPVFLGTPILYSPWLSFSLNNERKSGLLTPTAGSTSKGGIEFTQPFYWNIAQNMDATIAPRFMAKRGMLWNGEYRYLQPTTAAPSRASTSRGQAEHKRRSSYSVSHRQSLGYGFSGTLALNGASDDTYFSDLGKRLVGGRADQPAAPGHPQLQRRLVVGQPAGAKLPDPAGSLPAAGNRTLPAPAAGHRQCRSRRPAARHEFRIQRRARRTSATRRLVQGRRFTLYPQLSLPCRPKCSAHAQIGLHSTRYTSTRQAAVRHPGEAHPQRADLQRGFRRNLRRAVSWHGQR
jgi:LPS-assembly protein